MTGSVRDHVTVATMLSDRERPVRHKGRSTLRATRSKRLELIQRRLDLDDRFAAEQEQPDLDTLQDPFLISRPTCDPQGHQLWRLPGTRRLRLSVQGIGHSPHPPP
jgi:hypothetical protein